jgi:anti-anti-sigma regulatory factor
MAGVDVSTRECDGQVFVALRGQLDMAEAAGAAAAFTAVAARGPQIIVDLAGLEFIDSSGVAALVRGRCCGCLTLTRLVDVFPVHATVAEAAGHYRRVPVLPRRRSLASWPRAAIRSGALALVRERRQLRKRAGAAEALPSARTAEPLPSCRVP